MESADEIGKVELKSYIRQSAECPFFHGDDGERVIRCEGPIERTMLDLRLASKKQWLQHIRGWCCNAAGGYKNCEIYRMLVDIKYGD